MHPTAIKTKIFGLTLVIAGSLPVADAWAIERSNAAGEHSSSTSPISRVAEGAAPATLEPREDGGGYFVRFEKGPLSFNEPPVLVSINKKDLRGLNGKQINNLLRGPTGSSLDVEVMRPDGKVRTVELVRDAITNKPLCNHVLTDYDERSGGNWNGAYVEDSLDIDARATQNLILREAREWPDKTTQAMSTAAFCAAITNYEVGNLDEADRDLSLSEHTYKKGQKWGLQQNRRVDQIFKVLISVERGKDAQQLLRMLIDVKGPRFDYDAAFKPLALWELRIGDKQKALETVGEFQQLRPGFARTWVGEFCEQAAEYEKAEQVYQARVAGMNRSLASNPSNVQWENLQDLAADFWHEAYCQYKQGKKDAAMTSLQSAIGKLKDSLTQDQLETVERMPAVFPKLTDLEKTLQIVETGNPFPEPGGPQVGQTFPDIRTCHDAIKNDDKKSASRLVDSFLDSYKGNVPQAMKSSGEQNLYCSILTLAREMSDKGWFALSDHVLHRLLDEAYGKDANSVARTFLQAEMIYNACKEKSSDSLQTFETAYAAMPVASEGSTDGPTFASSEALRKVSLAFYYANELGRAEFFINQAIARHERESKTNRCDVIEVPYERIGGTTMLLLDAACIAAKQKHFQQVDIYWREVEALTPIATDGYYGTIMELCSVYVDNHKTEQAISMLKSVQPKRADIRHLVVSGKTALQLMLASLLRDSGKVKEAAVIADDAADTMPPLLQVSQILLMAQCAEAAGEYGRAAHYYARVAASGTPFLFQAISEIDYRQKALNLADKDPGFDKAALAKLCTEVADRVSARDPKKAQVLYQRACDLTPDSDPQKSSLLMKLAATKSAVLSKAGAVDIDKIKQQDLAERKRIAVLAEQNHHPDCKQLWTQLACVEVSEGLISEGLKDEHHLMDLYGATDAANHMGVLGIRSWIVQALVSKGHIEDAERLLLDAVAKTKAIAGGKSAATQAQLADLFIFYVQQKTNAAALGVLDQILACDLTTGETITQASTHSHCGLGWSQPADAVSVLEEILEAVQRVESTEPVFAKSVLEKILAAQMLVLKPEDERILPSLAALGDACFQMNNYADAQKYYDQAYALSTRYHKGEFAVRLAGRNYIANLRKMGKVAEADRLSELQYEGVGK